ncbi:MAG: hypothetical protein IJY53_06350 [Akkermansia sp.]|nr:hypothetical protein [Akkermansia sp.]
MIRHLSILSICAAGLSSCIITPKNLVPDMPHNAMWRQRAQQEAMAARVHLPAAQQANTPLTPTATPVQPEPVAQSPIQPTAVTPKPVAVTPKPVTPVAKPAAKPAGTRITQAPATKPTVTTPKPVAVTPTPVTPTPVAVTPQPVPTTPAVTPTVPTPAPAITSKADLKRITNENGVIPYAKRVPGDPTRVYNPLAPDLTIRTVHPTTGKPLPKDTILKVSGTEFMFKVP